ncbi:LacI family DNA-binding transcriptional regulator [Mesorhizobium sp. M1C.F.Ca.ET.193.01.1.1]|uniref:LacI family DNA-binding transcriptional regulator n=1 Tax=unclassified Mesorhizobium TaxID=325217 RepID=UPI000FD56AE6|nr:MULTISPECIES: substrate-binding domain-containing protein [unclassified Mesorhizobium]TGT00307.1 LacI family DNA-binding transcriptional regulator [bacterium M00.F.Ca.ET.177.01.1.1]TGQ53712.1 LacI family DNA-binding transcriptional regulator [Mesorhizobium sp. M1C.F.Ca.ET.210.01.1.1]TGQ71745.1 LacI family DNA-binding transcriptional regulator [Mesorhizobium sp. M1C.F.Ca.ET.212.01.1.1]TGR08486.1 LacI family DNA-binding transcriptional regulator [Mesorhizobium sp. M1C.F.Ca.ET.204.01.1.1]TGR28
MASVLEGQTRPIRLADIAKAAGVSHGTASNVFSRPEIVRAEVRERVKAVAEAMGYAGPDPKGRLLRAGKVNAIGVCTTEPLSYFFEDPFACVMMAGISQACDATGAGIALVSAQNDEKLAWNIQSALVDGFILFCIEGGPRLVELTRERRLPFVALAIGFDDDTISMIGIDNVAGSRLAARHLGNLGHRRFAVLSLPFVDDSTGLVTPERLGTALYTATRDRLAGYFEELSRFGIDTNRVPVYETGNEETSTKAGLETIFAGAEPPTAILAMSDRMAMVAIDWLTERGLNVPDDVSVIGFDGVPDGARCDPPLTTIAQPITEIGRRAARMILDYDGTVRRETMGVELVVRASTGPAPKA